MLNKDICRKCVERKRRWESRDDKLWEIKGYVEYVVGIIHQTKTATRTIISICKIKDDPPSYCPYFLEHIMKEDEKNVE